MAYCRKCGTQLSEGAKFCPKCGHPTGISIETKEKNSFESEPVIDYTEEEEESTYSLKKLLMTIAIIAVVGIAGYYGIKQYQYMSQKQAEIQRQKENDEKVKKALGLDNYSRSLNVEGLMEGEKSEKQKSHDVQETKESSIQYTMQLEEIANEINNVYNQYVALASDGHLDPMTQGNMQIKVTRTLSDLSRQAESTWNKIIAIARNKGDYEAARNLELEKKQYMSDVAKIQFSVHDVGINNY